MIYLDESGVTTQMTRRYARCRAEARIFESPRHGNWKILTILGAISTRGMIATMTIEEATDPDIFLAYLEEVWCPALRAGDVVVMDNLSAHKVNGVRNESRPQGPNDSICPLFTGPEPHRKGMVQTQTTTTYRSCKEAKEALDPSDHRAAPGDHTRECRGVVQAPPRHATVKVKML